MEPAIAGGSGAYSRCRVLDKNGNREAHVKGDSYRLHKTGRVDKGGPYFEPAPKRVPTAIHCPEWCHDGSCRSFQGCSQRRPARFALGEPAGKTTPIRWKRSRRG